jgi:hypothetical protein
VASNSSNALSDVGTTEAEAVAGSVAAGTASDEGRSNGSGECAEIGVERRGEAGAGLTDMS